MTSSASSRWRLCLSVVVTVVWLGVYMCATGNAFHFHSTVSRLVLLLLPQLSTTTTLSLTSPQLQLAPLSLWPQLARLVAQLVGLSVGRSFVCSLARDDSRGVRLGVPSRPVSSCSVAAAISSNSTTAFATDRLRRPCQEQRASPFRSSVRLCSPIKATTAGYRCHDHRHRHRISGNSSGSRTMEMILTLLMMMMMMLRITLPLAVIIIITMTMKVDIPMVVVIVAARLPSAWLAAYLSDCLSAGPSTLLKSVFRFLSQQVASDDASGDQGSLWLGVSASKITIILLLPFSLQIQL